MDYMKIDDFERARDLKSQESRRAMGLDPVGPYRSEDDLFEEAYCEALDLVNYLEEIGRRHKIQTGPITQKAREIGHWIVAARRSVQMPV